MKSKFSKVYILVGGFCILTMLGLLLVVFTPFANILSKPLIIHPSLQKADAILVLSGGVYKNGSLSYFSMERVIQAVTLYRKGLSQKIIFSGGVSLGNDQNHDAEAMKKVAMDLGVKEEDIILENQSKNTQENLQNSKNIIDQNHFKKVLLVTSAIHTYRSIFIGERVGLKLIPASSEPFDAYRQVPIDRLLLLYFTVREYAALMLYRFYN